MSENKQKDLVSTLAELPPSTQYNNPLNKLEGKQKKEWEDVKTAIKAGKLNHLSMNEIHRRVCQHFNIQVPRTTFRDTLTREGIRKPK